MDARSPRSAPLKILVVEDELLTSMELCDMLENGGFEVVGPAASVAAALTLLSRGRPDACVLDVNLRGELSVPVARALKEQNIPFLLSSAYTRETLDQYTAFEDVTHIGKPAPTERLRSTLASLLKDAGLV